MQLGYGVKRRKRVEISIEDSKTHLGWDASLCPCKDGIGGGSPRVWGETQMRVPRNKDSSNGPFVSALLVPDPLAANNADKGDFSHGTEKLPKLLPPSHKLRELQTSLLSSPPPVCAYCIGRELSDVFGSAGWMMTDSSTPHLDLSRLLLMANHPTYRLSVLFFHRRRQAGAWRLQLGGYMYNKGYASDCGLAIYIKKYRKAKEEELCKLKYFNMSKYNPLKETKILQDIITLQLISSFNTSQKNHLSKILI
jgi:hypothetical protein